MVDGEISANTEHSQKATTPAVFESAVKHDPTCRHKYYCKKMKLDEIACSLLEYIREDCPVSCKICTAVCKDDVKCKLISDIRNICNYQPEAGTMCPQSCGVCQNRNGEFGNFFKYSITCTKKVLMEIIQDRNIFTLIYNYLYFRSKL